MTISAFKKTIWNYYKEHGRHSLPWRKTHDPYAILVSEIMLQQTQVGRVEGYYEKFLKQFPNFQVLAAAKTSDVLKVWQGLGYNRRAIFLKRIAESVVKNFSGALPDERLLLESLPGIGKGTSGSLMAFAFNKPEIFIETNIRRVFIHFFFKNKKVVTDQELLRYIESSLDKKNAREWYWALMDYGSSMLGATRITNSKEKKIINPNRRSAHYKKQSLFAGSNRQVRGKIVRFALSVKAKKISIETLSKTIAVSQPQFLSVLDGLIKEGFIVRKGNYICITQR